MTQREIGHLEKSILIPPVSREILDYKTQPDLFRDDAIESTRESNAERPILGHLACHITRCDPFNLVPETTTPQTGLAPVRHTAPFHGALNKSG